MAPFPQTHWSVIKPHGAGPADPDARRAGLEALARLYWRPVYAHLRLCWKLPRDEAEDATQSFFLWVLEGPLLDRAEPGHGRFRNFVRVCLDNFMRKQVRAEGRLIRGGGAKILSLDFGPDPDALLSERADLRPEEILDHHWKRTVLDEAVARLKESLGREGRPLVFEAFRRFDLAENEQERPTQAGIARELGLAATEVDHYVRQARRRLYQALRDVVAESVDSDEALNEELALFFPRGVP